MIEFQPCWRSFADAPSGGGALLTRNKSDSLSYDFDGSWGRNKTFSRKIPFFLFHSHEVWRLPDGQPASFRLGKTEKMNRKSKRNNGNIDIEEFVQTQ